MNVELTDCFPVTADELWKGVLAETGSGGRKGRGKRSKRKLKRDLNRGQSIGEGEQSTVYLSLECQTCFLCLFTETVALKIKVKL